MKSSGSRSFFLLLAVLILLASPAAGQREEYVPGKGPFTNTIFDTSFVKALYKGSFDISKTHLSGLFMIKRTSPDAIRIVFSNEFGMTFFDFEYKGEEFILHYLYPEFDKRGLPKILENDFRMLLVPDPSFRSMKRGGSKDPEQVVFNVKSKRGNFRYTWDLDSGKVLRIQTLLTVIGRTDLQVSGGSGSCPGKISLVNSAIKLRIKLTLLGN